MVPVPRELELVRQILDLWRRGLSYRGIVAKLNENGVPMKRGGRLHAATVPGVVQRVGLVSRCYGRFSELSVYARSDVSTSQ